MVEKGAKEGRAQRPKGQREEGAGGGRSGRPKEARKNEGPPGRDEQKKPDQVCLQLARPLEPALEKRISCLWAIMYLDMLGMVRNPPAQCLESEISLLGLVSFVNHDGVLQDKIQLVNRFLLTYNRLLLARLF